MQSFMIHLPNFTGCKTRRLAEAPPHALAAKLHKALGNVADDVTALPRGKCGAGAGTVVRAGLCSSLWAHAACCGISPAPK